MIKKDTGRDDMIGKVALGATGIALAAGGVAAAVLLSNRKNRTTLKRVAGTAKKAFENGAERFQSYQHKIGPAKKRVSAILHKVDLGKKKALKRKG